MLEKEYFDADINLIEECFIEAGMERMSKYFDHEVFENGVLAEHILWDKEEYYFMVEKKDEKHFEIKYSNTTKIY